MTNDNYGNNRPDSEFEPGSGSTRYTGNSDSFGGAYDEAYDGSYAAEPIDAEIVDDTEYRGAHRRDDDSEYIEDVDYGAGQAGYADDTRYLPGAGAAAAGAAGAGAAGAAGARRRSRNADDAIYDEPYDGAYEEDYDGEPKGRRKAAAAGGAAEGGLPKRGLAMILIAVAALLALWGIWKMTQDDKGGDGEGAAPTSSTVVGTSAAAPAGDGAGQNGQGADGAGQGAEGQGGAATGADQNTQTTDGQPAQDPNAQDPNAQRPEGAEGQGENGQPAPAPAPAGAGLDNASAQVYVYNNSGTPDLASRTADQLKGQYNVANNSADAAVMNMPEQVYGVFPETYVFFDPAVPGAEQVAADIARRVGGAARAKGDLPEGATSIPEQAANNSAAVAVVLAG
ncbi:MULTISPECIES: LytR C-terminal domain-containing protein [unclassified Corynebacterium]|uniref:LytR C-terminal domain-containing protein n=1 Tax=unclassified Corynebacterium TaxID=2624378 RepID=UPI001EF40223|nr:LytR C-terminal domain-containing protein [Corynebacterium sp. ACRPZ]MCG7295098.1 LytR C-terminal domain-containing protein [Corynebacterium sp. ACRPY]